MKKRTSICASILHTLRFTLRPARCQQLASETGKKRKKNGGRSTGLCGKCSTYVHFRRNPRFFLSSIFFFVPIAAKLSGLLPD